MSESLTSHRFEVHLENYLKAIWNLSQANENENGIVKNSQIAAYLKITRPTVTMMLRKIVKKGFLLQEKNGGVKLSKTGKRNVFLLLRKHRLIELFLNNTMKLEGMELHEEAELLEHAVSSRLLEKIDKFLNFPQHDLQGMLIPRDSEVDFIENKYKMMKMIDLDLGKTAIIEILPDFQPEILKFLLHKGLKKGLKVKMEEKLAPHYIRVKPGNGSDIILTFDQASQVLLRRA